jgi:hypothetical protein
MISLGILMTKSDFILDEARGGGAGVADGIWPLDRGPC